MRGRWWAVAGAAGLAVAALAALAVDVGAHVDGCHRWHSCPSDDGSYVCGDRGHCSECPDNQFCSLGRSRGAGATATRPPRPTRTPDPTSTPRPTRTTAPAVAVASPAASVSRADATPIANAGAVSSASGSALRAAPTLSAPAGAETAARAAIVLAERDGVRVLGPLQWSVDSEASTVAGAVHNSTADRQTMIVVLLLVDHQGGDAGTRQLALSELGPGESRSFVQALPSTTIADVLVRLEPLVP